MHKLINSLYDDDKGDASHSPSMPHLSEELATLIYILDVYSKHLIDIEGHPVRKVRENLDELSKELTKPDSKNFEKSLFRLRQYFSSYRVDEYSYVRKTFDDFKGILFDFVDQLGEDFEAERKDDKEIAASLHQLREAVEADSIDLLRSKSREFIDSYIERQSKKEQRRSQRMGAIRKNLTTVKKQLSEAHRTMQIDHMTGAYNRKSFEEQMKNHKKLFEVSRSPVNLLICDIDFFKKINDSYGHDIGDFIIKECVRLLKESFPRDMDFVARIGGEEFAILIPEDTVEVVTAKAEACLARIRKEVFLIKEGVDLRFTMSMGIAQLSDGESIESWFQRADKALYDSKHGGRDRWTLSPEQKGLRKVS